MDETWSFGIVGKTGRGVTEVFDLPVSVLLLTFAPCESMADTVLLVG